MRILVIKLSSLGDTLHALPTAFALKSHYGAELHWAVHPAFAPLVRCFSCVDKVVEVPPLSDAAGFLHGIKILRSSGVYDLIVDLQGLLKSAIVARCARGGERIGPSFQREGAELFYNRRAKKSSHGNRHAVDECMDVLDLLGIARPAKPEFPLNYEEFNLPDAEDSRFRVAVAPYSRWKTKNWPEKYFAETIRRLISEKKAAVYVLGGKSDKSAGDALAAESGAYPLCGSTSLAQTLGILKKCDVLLCNDSGPMHMAAATGTPCVAAFGPTFPERTGPYGMGNIVLRAGGCPPCRKRKCPRGTWECMRSISPASAFDAVCRILDRKAVEC